jgi:hypothetical protein
MMNMARDGLVEVYRPKGRTLGTRLFTVGEVRAQYLAGAPSLLDPHVWELFRAISRRNGAWVQEDDLLPCFRRTFEPIGEWTRTDELLFIEESLIPFMSRGWLEGRSTVLGNVRYRPGPKASEAAKPDIAVPRVTKADMEAAGEIYCAELNAWRVAMATEENAEENCIGEIPLNCSANDWAEVAAWKFSAELAARGE